MTNDWSLLVIIEDEYSNTHFGNNLRFNLDGNMIAVTSSLYDTATLSDVGSIQVYKENSGGQWTRLGSRLTGRGLTNDKFGEYEIDLSEDGSLVSSTGRKNGAYCINITEAIGKLSLRFLVLRAWLVVLYPAI